MSSDPFDATGSTTGPTTEGDPGLSDVPDAVAAGDERGGPREVGTGSVTAAGDRPVRPISIRRHVRVTFGIAVVAAVVVAASGVVGFWALLDAREQVVDRADPALLAATELLAGYVDQETGVRAYVLTGDSRFLTPYDEGEARAADDRARLERLGGGFDGVLPALAHVDGAVATWRTEYVEPTLDGVRAGDPSVREEATLAEGRERFDEIRAAVAELQVALVDARQDARQELSDTTARLVVTISLGAAVLLGLVAFLWRLMRLGVEGPLHQLGEDARQVSGGDLAHPVAPVGPVELQALGEAMEQMRHRIVEELDAVRAARDQLARQTEDLERSNAELEQFAYVASHDLQEPLRKVASFCQLLQSRYQGQLDERADQYIEFAVDGAKRMQALINDLLEFSRVGRRGGEADVVDADELLARALSNLSTAVEDTGAHITSDDLPPVRIEVSLGVALFQNLVSNAIKFRREGTEPHVTITVRPNDAGEHEFAVTDDGIGISPDYAERIFVIFQRLHGKEEYDGTGIGLALCRKIVEHHGGRIWVDTSNTSGEGHGTTVRFTLPAVQGDA
ncbi:MAG TPA: ATP-binding protein [Acidimicrobiales bacterium]